MDSDLTLFAMLQGLGYGCLSGSQKGMSLVYQVWLECGPDMSNVRAYFNSVYSVTSDWGVESVIVDLPDLLPAFSRQWLGKDMEPQRWLLPNAIWVPGERVRLTVRASPV